MRQVAFEVLCVKFAILWMMQQGIDIVEDIPFRHFPIILSLELCECPISDILTAIAAEGLVPSSRRLADFYRTGRVNGVHTEKANHIVTSRKPELA